MRFIVVLVGWSWTTDESEGSVGSEDYIRIVDGAEITELDSFEIVIGLEIEGIASEMGLPFGWDFIEALGCEIGLLTVFVAGGFEIGFEVLARGQDCFLDVAEGVEDVETESESEFASQQHDDNYYNLHPINLRSKNIEITKKESKDRIFTS